MTHNKREKGKRFFSSTRKDALKKETSTPAEREKLGWKHEEKSTEGRVPTVARLIVFEVEFPFLLTFSLTLYEAEKNVYCLNAHIYYRRWKM